MKLFVIVNAPTDAKRFAVPPEGICSCPLPRAVPPLKLNAAPGASTTVPWSSKRPLLIVMAAPNGLSVTPDLIPRVPPLIVMKFAMPGEALPVSSVSEPPTGKLTPTFPPVIWRLTVCGTVTSTVTVSVPPPIVAVSPTVAPPPG